MCFALLDGLSRLTIPISSADAILACSITASIGCPLSFFITKNSARNPNFTKDIYIIFAMFNLIYVPQFIFLYIALMLIINPFTITIMSTKDLKE